MLEQALLRRIKLDFNYGKLTRFGINGMVSRFFVAKNEKDLLGIIKLAKNNRWEYIVVGEGTNLIMAGDKDLLVIKNEIRGIRRINKTKYRVGAGENWTKLVGLFNRQGLGGTEKMYGVPGLVGGAVVGNAGCYGQEIKDMIVRVRIFDGTNIRWISKKDCKFGYRSSLFKTRKTLIVLGIEVHLSLANPLLLSKTSREIYKKRKEKFPKDLKCAGSYFKNIIVSKLNKDVRSKLESKYIGKIRDGKLASAVLIEAVGLKGARIGNVRIADYHGNLIINTGNGNYRDALSLALKAKSMVRKAFSVELEEEVRVI